MRTCTIDKDFAEKYGIDAAIVFSELSYIYDFTLVMEWIDENGYALLVKEPILAWSGLTETQFKRAMGKLSDLGLILTNEDMDMVIVYHEIHEVAKKPKNRIKKEASWRSNIEIYLQLVDEAYNLLVNDTQYINSQEQYYTNIDIPKSIKKGVEEFWGTERGWKHKKKTRGDIDMVRTLKNSINFNKVYKPFKKEQDNASLEYLQRQQSR